MKTIFICCLFVAFFNTLYGQTLIEDKQGDQIANNFPLLNASQGINTYSSIKLNTGNQALGFNYFSSTALIDPSNYKINQFGIEAKPTEGYASVFSNGQYSPGIKVTYSHTKVPLTTASSNFTDWAGISLNYEINNYSLFKRDTIFKNQSFTKSFKGITAFFNYNMLINSIGIINVRLGYSRRNNYEDLKSIEIRDVNVIFDSLSATQRQITKSKTLKEGTFSEFDTFPIIVSYTRATPTDGPDSPDALKLRLGYTVFFKNIISKNLPKTTIGAIFFLTKQDKTGVRNPVFGLSIQTDDPFDIQNTGNNLTERINIGFTSIFSL